MLLALSTLAHADPMLVAREDMICMEVNQVSPEPDAQDVALDHVPAAIASGACISQPVVVDLFIGDELVASHEERVNELGLVELDLDEDLEPHTTYTFVATPEGSSAVVVEFTTGDRLSVLPDDPPQLMAVDADQVRDVTHLDASVDLMSDPEGPFFVELVDDEGVLWGLSHHTDPGVATLSGRSVGDRPGEVCITALQRHADGTRSESETVCDTRTGCSAAGLGAMLLPSIFALGLVRRRKRCS
ncbi:MAG: hypothetical protein GY913_33595 [Proteobacteria bacterium]|nr:hypothetical protein [Pseudomonadota bacterium]